MLFYRMNYSCDFECYLFPVGKHVNGSEREVWLYVKFIRVNINISFLMLATHLVANCSHVTSVPSNSKSCKHTLSHKLDNSHYYTISQNTHLKLFAKIPVMNNLSWIVRHNNSHFSKTLSSEVMSKLELPFKLKVLSLDNVCSVRQKAVASCSLAFFISVWKKNEARISKSN